MSSDYVMRLSQLFSAHQAALWWQCAAFAGSLAAYSVAGVRLSRGCSLRCAAAVDVLLVR